MGHDQGSPHELHCRGSSRHVEVVAACWLNDASIRSRRADQVALTGSILSMATHGYSNTLDTTRIILPAWAIFRAGMRQNSRRTFGVQIDTGIVDAPT